MVHQNFPEGVGMHHLVLSCVVTKTVGKSMSRTIFVFKCKEQVVREIHPVRGMVSVASLDSVEVHNTYLQMSGEVGLRKTGNFFCPEDSSSYLPRRMQGVVQGAEGNSPSHPLFSHHRARRKHRPRAL